MKNQKKLTLEDGDAINADTRRILNELAQQLKEDQKRWEKERKQREKERKQREEERKKAELQREEERKRAELQREEERKRAELQREEERKQREEELKAEKAKREESQRDFMARMDHLDKLFAQTREEIGGISQSNGEFCEEYFINSFKENPTLFGEKYDRVMPYLYPDPVVINDEYDLVLRNGTTIALIEMKYKARTKDVGKMFSKLHTYRANYPMFKDYKIYLCLASFRFPKNVRIKAAEEGIVLIQQRGEKIEVISENIRTW